jgi:CRISPR-associated protein Csx17
VDAEHRLPVLALPGLSPASLGNYLAALGLLRVLSHKWPSTRIAWRDEVLQVVGGPTTLDELSDELVLVAATQTDADVGKRAWTLYDKAWSDAQKAGTKAKSGVPLAAWQAAAPESALQLFAAHAVPHARVSFNPLLGSGGNAGRRDFAAGWKKAVNALEDAISALKQARTEHASALAAADQVRNNALETHEETYREAIANAASGRTEAARTKATSKADDARTKGNEKAHEKHRAAVEKANDAFRKVVQPQDQLRILLRGQPSDWIAEKLGAGSWFSEATKLYNSGQSPAREGQVSPWAMALACEGLAFLAGGASRRLGARSARAVGAFPFVTQPIAASAEKEADRLRGEIWTPLWSRPMSLAEASTLFSRGRAELHGRGALTPAAFATAIRERGVDAGVSEFRRFTLGRTTSSNTFEPRLEARFSLMAGAEGGAAASAMLGRVTALIEQRGFPRDGKRFVGLRGPIEAALLDVAANPMNPEAGVVLLDATVSALDRIDRNRGFREGTLRWEPLPLEWLASLFSEEQPSPEARLALSLVSAFPATLPFASFRFGVEWVREQNGKREYDWATQPRWFEHSKVAPARWVWGPGQLARVLGAVLSRRLLEEQRLDGAASKRLKGRAPLPATASQVRQWLAGDLDEKLFAAWLARLALFDWRSVPQEVRAIIVRDCSSVPKADGELALLGLVQPLVDQRPLVIRDLSGDDLLAEKTGARTTEAARSLVTLTRAGNFDAVIRLASSRYSMAHARLATFDVTFAADSPERLVAALLFTLSGRDRAVLFERWLRPRRRPQRGEVHV